MVWPWLVMLVLWEDRFPWSRSGGKTWMTGPTLTQAGGLVLVLVTVLVSLDAGWRESGLFPWMQRWVGQAAYFCLVGGGLQTAWWFWVARRRPVRMLLWPWLTVTTMGVLLGARMGWRIDEGWVVMQWLVHGLVWALWRRNGWAERWALWTCSLTVTALYAVGSWPVFVLLLMLVTWVILAYAADLRWRVPHHRERGVRPWAQRMWCLWASMGDVVLSWGERGTGLSREVFRGGASVLMGVGRGPLPWAWFALILCGLSATFC
jgi:hypothetical protein